MIVVVDGPSGSGKTTIGRHLAEAFDVRFISAGEIFRKMADEAGYNPNNPDEFQEWHELTEADLSFDRKLDRRMAEEAEKGDCVVQGRISAFFVKSCDIAIFLRIDPRVAAERVSKRDGQSVDEALRASRKRDESNRKRYNELYGIDYLEDMSPYNFVIDTSHLTIEQECEIAEKIVRYWTGDKG